MWSKHAIFSGYKIAPTALAVIHLMSPSAYAQDSSTVQPYDGARSSTSSGNENKSIEKTSSKNGSNPDNKNTGLDKSIPTSNSPSQTEVNNQNDDQPNVANTIVVTGTHIRGVENSVGNQIISIGQEEIRQAGHASVRDVFEVLPQNFGGGATGERQLNSQANVNTGQGTTINLRGIGSSATLVLLNGRRLPAGGFDASLVDVSLIPIAAIERIEILPDGASAVYGSDAVAGVVNFILRRNYEGLETRLRYGTVTDGSLDEFQASQNAGLHWDSGNMLIAYEFTHRDRLPNDDLSYARTADFRDRGGADYRYPVGNPGIIIDPFTFQPLYAIPPGQNGTTLTIEQLLPPDPARFRPVSADRDITPKQRRHSAFGAFNQEIYTNLEFFAELRFAERTSINRNPNDQILIVPSTNPYYVDVFGTGEPVYISYSFSEQVPASVKSTVQNYGGVAGLTLTHPSQWQTELYVSLNREDALQNSRNTVDAAALNAALAATDPAAALNPFGSGPIDNFGLLDQIFVDEFKLDTFSKVDQVNLTTNGPLFPLWDSFVRGAVGADYRREKFSREYKSDPSLQAGEFRREVTAVFGELYLPLVQESLDIPGIRVVDLSFSLRHEKHEDKAIKPERRKKPSESSTDPRIGLHWSPFEGIRLNASYGTSFRAPGLYTLGQPTYAAVNRLPDPQSPSGTTQALVLLGSRQLKNETAQTWTFGVDLSKPDVTNFRIKANAFRIRFEDQVTSPFFSLALADPALSSLVTRDVSVEQVRDACNLAPLQNQFGCNTPEIVGAIVDARIANLAKTNIDGFDFEIGYVLDLDSYGLVNFTINGTRLTRYEFAFAPEAPLENRLDRPNYPLDFRARGALAWSPSSDAIISIFINYSDKYRDDIHDREVKSNTTVDFTASYSIGKLLNNTLFGDIDMQLIVNNLFDDRPPFYENGALSLPYDPANSEPLGRFVSFSLTKRW